LASLAVDLDDGARERLRGAYLTLAPFADVPTAPGGGLPAARDPFERDARDARAAGRHSGLGRHPTACCRSTLRHSPSPRVYQLAVDACTTGSAHRLRLVELLTRRREGVRFTTFWIRLRAPVDGTDPRRTGSSRHSPNFRPY
jgi:hypothetical protein